LGNHAFEAVVWFLDPTIPIPNIHLMTEKAPPSDGARCGKGGDANSSVLRVVSCHVVFVFCFPKSTNGACHCVHVLAVLVDVEGVTLTCDLSMSRKFEDVSSLDMHFITPNMRWVHQYVGLLSCAERSSGPTIARKLAPPLKRFNIQNRIFVVVKA
jgi:hypothetical protein